MAVCLNTETSLILYSELVNSEYFVDKSAMIEAISRRIRTNTKYICITKPRRFGKTSILNMLGAYYGKAYDSKGIFDSLKISGSATYRTHLNQYNVIRLSLNDLPDDGCTYEDYIGLIKESITNDIQEAYPELREKKFHKISDLLMPPELFPEPHSAFLEFLRNLLKDRAYVALTYMTGVLPIKKYSTGSSLNMFREYTMLKDPFFEEYFGFTESEVEALCEKQTALSMEEIRDWYNGYQTRGGERLYNPRSVVCALEDAACQSYWTRTGKMDEVLFFLKYNIGEVRDDVVKW